MILAESSVKSIDKSKVSEPLKKNYPKTVKRTRNDEEQDAKNENETQKSPKLIKKVLGRNAALLLDRRISIARKPSKTILSLADLYWSV